MTRHRWLVPAAFLPTLALPLALPLVLGACGDASPGAELRCERTSQCPAGYHCRTPGGAGPGTDGTAGRCVGDVPCQADAECCLGERCEDLRCRPRQMCSVASPCGEPGTVCSAGLCVPAACENDSACAAGRVCQFGRCVQQVPCGGHCADGEACAVVVDRCVALRGQQPACPAGQLRVLANDEARLTEGCFALPELTTCRDLPVVPEGQIGVPGVLVKAGSALLHVAYDRTYGDVVLARHALAPPFARQSLQVLSGLPDAAPVVGAPHGPRGGVAAPGPDHGSALDAVVDTQGRLHVVFRDATADALRYLRREADGGVHGHVIAVGPGAGTAVTVDLGPGEVPIVAAFTPARPKAPSRLDLFRASTAAPAAGSDWAAVLLDQEALPAQGAPCSGGCPAGQTCAAFPPGEACVTPATGGCGTCLPSQVCHAGACRDVRLAEPELDGVPPGRGAWLALAVAASGEARVAAYSAAQGDLALYRQSPGAQAVKTVLQRQAVPGGSADFGRFASFVAGGDDGEPWLTCEDTAAGRLLLLRLPQGAKMTAEVLDDGLRPDGLHRVGADVRAVRQAGGGLLAVYQDTRRGDLVLLRRPKAGGAGERTLLAQDGAAGFSPTLAAVGAKAWAVAATALRVEPKGGIRHEVTLHAVVWSGE